MTTRTITGTVKKLDGSNWVGAEIHFKLLTLFAASNGVSQPQDIYTFTTDANGQFTGPIAVPDAGYWSYQCTDADESHFHFALNLDDGSAVDYADLKTQPYVSSPPSNWSQFVKKAGDTMTGALVLPGDPIAPLEAATKDYVDNSPGSGGVGEAPIDGSPYSRQDGDWTPAVPDILTGHGQVITHDGSDYQPVAAGSNGQPLVSSGGGAPATFRQVPTSGIDDQAVDNSKLATMGANTIKMRPTVGGAPGDAQVEDLADHPSPQSTDVLLGQKAGGDLVSIQVGNLPGGGGGIPDAPADGTAYGRKDAAWANVVDLAGDQMTGPLALGGVAQASTQLTITDDGDTDNFLGLVDQAGAGQSWALRPGGGNYIGFLDRTTGNQYRFLVHKSGRVSVGAPDTVPDATLDVEALVNSIPVLLLRGASGQTGALLEMYDAINAQVLEVDPDGHANHFGNEIRNYRDTATTVSPGASYTVNGANGNLWIITLTANLTLDFSNMAGKSVTIVLIQDGVGSHTVTWDAAMIWPSGTEEQPSDTINSVNKFIVDGDGTRLYGQLVGKDFA